MKPRNEFYARLSAADGLQSACMECAKAANRLKYTKAFKKERIKKTSQGIYSKAGWNAALKII